MQTIDTNDLTKPFTHRASLNGTTVEFHADDYDRVVAELVEKQGGGVPDVQPLAKINAATYVEPKTPAPALVRQPVTNRAINVGEYSAEGDARSQRDREAATAAGFSPKQPVYRQGSRASGMRRFRDAFDKLPLATVAAEDLVARVSAEQRCDVEYPATGVRLNKEGLLALGRRRLAFGGRRPFASLVARLAMPAGAGTYLPAIDAELRAVNVNQWVANEFAATEEQREKAHRENEKVREREALAKRESFEARPFEPSTLVFRTRTTTMPEGEHGLIPLREVFGVVSDSYGEFDADRIAQAIKLAVPEGARARVAYDGQRTKFDVIFFSNIVPEDAVAGEFFKAAVQVRTDDTGGGSLVVSAAVHQNLCLNFIILDKAVGAVTRIRHLGSTEELAKRFREAFAAALKQIDHFLKAWGYAQHEDAAARALVLARQTGEVSAEELDRFAARPVSEVLPGIFNGLIERELVPLPKKNRAETVKQLMAMWEKDESAATRERQAHLTRAAVVNALTRYAHEVNEDAFVEAEIESAAGALLVGKNGNEPAPLPFSPLPG